MRSPMPKITKVVIDTNIFIKSLERELEKLSTKGGLDLSLIHI